jgi:hypothetical protein
MTRKPPPDTMLVIHYRMGKPGRTAWLEPAEAEKLAASLRKKGINVEIVHRETKP